MPIRDSTAKASSSAIPSVSRMVRRMACTASGPLAAIAPASSRALPRAWPSGTTWPISPIRCASAALRCRPVSSISAAIVYGICRGSRTADPPSGNSPQRASETPNRALSPATRTSVAWRISVPPATAGPSTAATSGLVSRRPLSSASIRDRSAPPLRKPSPGCDRVIALRSAPAQKAPPAPVRTQARIPGSASTLSHAARMMASISAESALRTRGLFIVTIRTGPRCSTRACGSSATGSTRSPLGGACLGR